MKSKGSVLVVFLAAAVLVLSVFGVWAGRNFFGKKVAVNQATPSARSELKSPGYSKRHYLPGGEFFQGQKYSKELTDISDNNLVEMECPEGYVRQAGGGFTLASNPEVLLNDQRLKKIMSTLDKDLGFSAFNFCNFKDGGMILEYEYWKGGGGKDTVAKFAVLDTNLKVSHITDINNLDKIPYFVCDVPLQLTSNNQLYWECRGGDGGFGAGSIYKIDLNNNQAKAILSCTSRAGEPSATCK